MPESKRDFSEMVVVVCLRCGKDHTIARKETTPNVCPWCNFPGSTGGRQAVAGKWFKTK